MHKKITEAITIADLDGIKFDYATFDHETAEEECRSEVIDNARDRDDDEEEDEEEVDYEDEVMDCVHQKMEDHRNLNARQTSFSTRGIPFKIIFTPEEFEVGNASVKVFHVDFRGPSGEELSNLSGTNATAVYQQVMRSIAKFAQVEKAKGFIIDSANTATYSIYDRLMPLLSDFTLAGMHSSQGKVYLRKSVADRIRKKDAETFDASKKTALSTRDDELKASSIERDLARSARRATNGLVGKIVPFLSGSSWSVGPVGQAAVLVGRVNNDLSFVGKDASGKEVNGRLHLDVPLPFNKLGQNPTQADIDRIVATSDPDDESLFQHLALLRMGFSNVNFKNPSRGRLDKKAYEKDKKAILDGTPNATPGGVPSFREWILAHEAHQRYGFN